MWLSRISAKFYAICAVITFASFYPINVYVSRKLAEIFILRRNSAYLDISNIFYLAIFTFKKSANGSAQTFLFHNPPTLAFSFLLRN